MSDVTATLVDLVQRVTETPDITATTEFEGLPNWVSLSALRLLADRMVELGYIDAISNVAVYKRLKKTNSSPGKSRRGV